MCYKIPQIDLGKKKKCSDLVVHKPNQTATDNATFSPAVTPMNEVVDSLHECTLLEKFLRPSFPMYSSVVFSHLILVVAFFFPFLFEYFKVYVT